MKTITREYKIYSFGELDEATQEKVLERNSDFNDYDDMLEAEVEHQKEELLEAGYDDVEILYDISYSQGSGASFTAGKVDLKKFISFYKLEEKFPLVLEYIEDVYATVARGSSFYYHEKTTYSAVEIDADYLAEQLTDEEYNKLEAEVELLVKLLDEDVEERNYNIYKSLREDYEAQTSREALIQSFADNGIYFTEDGKIFY